MDAVLGPLRERATAVMHIGARVGATTRMWRHYFPNAHVYGAFIPGTFQKKIDARTSHGGSHVVARIRHPYVGIGGIYSAEFKMIEKLFACRHLLSLGSIAVEP